MSTHEQWIAAYLDGTLSESEQAALSAWLREAPENMRVFVEHNHFEQQISQTVRSQAQREAAAYFQETAAEVPPPVTAKVPVRSRITRLSRWFLPLSAAAVILIGFFLWMRPQTATPGSRTPATVARIISLRGIQMPAKGPAYAVGQALAPGRLILGAGAMKLALENGVGIVFEGPGELQIIDPMRAVLHSGQVVVDVPPHATGFRLDTPAAGIVDLGTEFGAKVGPGLTTDVLVFDGEVITTASAGGFPQQITEGHAVRFEPGNGADSSPLPYAPDRFLRNLSVTPPVNYEHRLDSGFNTPRHEEIEVLPVIAPPVIDGDLADWTQEGAFRGEREDDPTRNHFLEGRLRYDSDFLFIAARVGDPAPLRNIIDPAVDPEFAWRGGAIQIRLAADAGFGWPVEGHSPAYFRLRKMVPDAAQVTRATDDRFASFTMWHHAPSQRDCLYLEYGLDYHGGRANPPDYRGAIRRTDDGTGYTLEYAIPWSLLHAPRPPRAGETLPLTWTIHWSDETGRSWSSQLNEVRNLAEPSHILSWERSATWGRAVFR